MDRSADEAEVLVGNQRTGEQVALAEYLEPEARFEKLQVSDTIVFFGSARIRSREVAEAELSAAKKGGGDLGAAEMNYKMSRYYENARELAMRLTKWSKSLKSEERRFVICTGGGPGIMEACNRGASEAKGLNIGLTISIPLEEFENPFVTRQLAFEFHYFFMRKFWFTYLAKAVVIMPGGWDEVINLKALVKYGTIDESDLDLFHRTDSVDDAYHFITQELTEHALTAPGPTL